MVVLLKSSYLEEMAEELSWRATKIKYENHGEFLHVVVWMSLLILFKMKFRLQKRA